MHRVSCNLIISSSGNRISQRFNIDSIVDRVYRSVSWLLIVGIEERQRFHQLIALRDWQVRIVQRLARLAVSVKPPVALQDRLVE